MGSLRGLHKKGVHLQRGVVIVIVSGLLSTQRVQRRCTAERHRAQVTFRNVSWQGPRNFRCGFAGGRVQSEQPDWPIVIVLGGRVQRGSYREHLGVDLRGPSNLCISVSGTWESRACLQRTSALAG